MTYSGFDGMTEKLEDLNSTITFAERRVAEEIRDKKRQEEEDKRADKKFWEGERERYSDKLKLAEAIFSWGREFSRSKQFRRLLELVPPVLTWSDSSLRIYAGGWGHERKESYGCWSSLYLRKDGTFYYTAGYKWMPCGPKYSFGTPSELVRRLSEIYLNKLCHFIVTGEVYESLRKSVKDYVDFRPREYQKIGRKLGKVVACNKSSI